MTIQWAVLPHPPLLLSRSSTCCGCSWSPPHGKVADPSGQGSPMSFSPPLAVRAEWTFPAWSACWCHLLATPLWAGLIGSSFSLIGGPSGGVDMQTMRWGGWKFNGYTFRKGEMGGVLAKTLQTPTHKLSPRHIYVSKMGEGPKSQNPIWPLGILHVSQTCYPQYLIPQKANPHNHQCITLMHYPLV